MARGGKREGAGRKANSATGVNTPKASPNPKGTPQNLAPAWQPGQSGNPNGRPKGSRNKLAETFLQDMLEAWEQNGDDVITKVIADDPATFLRCVVQIMPKEVDVTVTKYDELTDDQLKNQFLAALREARALGVDIGAGDAASVH